MGKTNPENDRHRQHSTILVPRDTPGVKLVRTLRVFDNLHSPGGEAELLFDNVRVPVSNMIKGEGCGCEIARCRCDIEQARLLTLQAAHVMDTPGMKAAIPYISMVKIVAPNMAQQVADRAMQVFGGMGVCEDTLIPDVFTLARFSRIADGPDEEHMSQLGKLTARALTA